MEDLPHREQRDGLKKQNVGSKRGVKWKDAKSRLNSEKHGMRR